MATPAKEQFESVVRTIFRRCVECPSGTPGCPSCPDGQICSSVLQSCHRCARTECVSMGSSSEASTSSVSESDSGGSGPNAGAIAGGVIGGIIFFAVLVWLFWRFVLKGKRNTEPQYDWDQNTQYEEKYEDDNFTMRRDARASTHTVASMASTVLTRASNIIQIAYIPGVTNRSGPASPQPLVPPVPPIPAIVSPHSPGSGHNSEADLHFLPGDIRDSTYTDGRNSYARSSIAPSLARQSVASTVYRNNAVVSPATTVVRGKAAMVSVKNNSTEASPSGTPGVDTPSMPVVPAHLQNQQAKLKSPGGSIRSVAQLGKPQAINVTRKKSSDLLTSPISPGSGSSSTDPSITAALAAASSTRPLDASPSLSANSRSPMSSNQSPHQAAGGSYFDGDSDDEDESGPFADSAQKKQIAEAVRRASKTTDQRSRSPFDDEHAIHDR